MFFHQRFDPAAYERVEDHGSWVEKINRELGSDSYGLIRGKGNGNFALVVWRGNGKAFTSIAAFADKPDNLPTSTAARFEDVELDAERGALSKLPSMDIVLRDLSRGADEAWEDEQKALEESYARRDQIIKENREKAADLGKHLAGPKSPLPRAKRDHPHVRRLRDEGRMPEGRVWKDFD